MKKIYYLKTCDTCKRILTDLNINDQIKLQEIKSNPLNENQLEELYQLSNSYESLFNKRAKLYRELDLKNKILSEQDYKNYLLSEYTFLKRPVAIIDNTLFIGNSKKTIAELTKKLNA